MALAAVDGLRLGPLYTPNTLRGTIMRPSIILAPFSVVMFVSQRHHTTGVGAASISN